MFLYIKWFVSGSVIHNHHDQFNNNPKDIKYIDAHRYTNGHKYNLVREIRTMPSNLFTFYELCELLVEELHRHTYILC